MCEKDRERIITAGDVVAPRERRNELVTNVAAHSLPQPEACGAYALPGCWTMQEQLAGNKTTSSEASDSFLSTHRSFFSTASAFLTCLHKFTLCLIQKQLSLKI